MTIPVFPKLYGFSIHKRPTFSSIVQSHKSGREVTDFQQAAPLWEFELVAEILRDRTQNQVPFDPLSRYTEFSQVLQLFNACNGQFGWFYFDDESDNSRTGQGLATGDGTTTSFLWLRTIYSNDSNAITFTEPTAVNTNHSVTVYLDGTPLSEAGNWTISADGTSLEFVVPPGVGVVVSADFYFYYLCRFITDDLDFEQFMTNRWTNKGIKFRSVDPHGLAAPDPLTPPPVPPPPGKSWHVTILPLIPTSLFCTPLSISRSGTVAVGVAFFVSGGEGVTWDLIALTIASPVPPWAPPPLSFELSGVADDNVTVIGGGFDSSVGHTIQGYWAGGIVFNPLSNYSGGNQSTLYDISGDATIVVGHVNDPGITHAATWNIGGTGPNLLTNPFISSNFAEATAISEDKNTIMGDASDPSTGYRIAVKWTGGIPVILDSLISGTYSQVYRGSRDGSIAVGAASDGSTQQAVYWSGTSITALTAMAGSPQSDDSARGISDDLMVICGNTTNSDNNDVACVWRSGTLEILPVPGGTFGASDSTDAYAISGDGNTAVGTGFIGGVSYALLWKYF